MSLRILFILFTFLALLSQQAFPESVGLFLRDGSSLRGELNELTSQGLTLQTGWVEDALDFGWDSVSLLESLRSHPELSGDLIRVALIGGDQVTGQWLGATSEGLRLRSSWGQELLLRWQGMERASLLPAERLLHGGLLRPNEWKDPRANLAERTQQLNRRVYSQQWQQPDWIAGSLLFDRKRSNLVSEEWTAPSSLRVDMEIDLLENLPMHFQFRIQRENQHGRFSSMIYSSFHPERVNFRLPRVQGKNMQAINYEFKNGQAEKLKLRYYIDEENKRIAVFVNGQKLREQDFTWQQLRPLYNLYFTSTQVQDRILISKLDVQRWPGGEMHAPESKGPGAGKLQLLLMNGELVEVNEILSESDGSLLVNGKKMELMDVDEFRYGSTASAPFPGSEHWSLFSGMPGDRLRFAQQLQWSEGRLKSKDPRFAEDLLFPADEIRVLRWEGR